MLAKHGPWERHVRVRGTDAMNEAVMWLARQGKAENVDYEILIEQIQTKNTQKVFAPVKPGSSWAKKGITGHYVPVAQPIMFFNESSLASYVKLTWG